MQYNKTIIRHQDLKTKSNPFMPFVIGEPNLQFSNWSFENLTHRYFSPHSYSLRIRFSKKKIKLSKGCLLGRCIQYSRIILLANASGVNVIYLLITFALHFV